MSRWKPDAEGRLVSAALTLFAERGYDDTTVAQIAEAAGLTKRTFFRYFADKREVLFKGSEQLQQTWVDSIASAPVGAGPMAAVSCALDAVAALFVDRLPFARVRAQIIATHPDLQERELIKLQTLAGAVSDALVERGEASNAAILASQAAVTVFHVAFAQWLEQDDPAAMRQLMDRALQDLRTVTAA